MKTPTRTDPSPFTTIADLSDVRGGILSAVGNWLFNGPIGVVPRRRRRLH